MMEVVMFVKEDFTEGVRVRNTENGFCGTVQRNFPTGVSIWMNEYEIPVVYDVEKGLAFGSDVIQGVDFRKLIKI